MRTFIAKDVVNMVQEGAEKDAGEGTTGWACIGAVSCAYYPISERHNWFINNQVSNKGDVVKWVSKQLLPSVHIGSASVVA